MTTPPTPWDQAQANKRAKRQEERLASDPGGRRQVNSGRHWFSKRDVRLNGFLIEARTTQNIHYTVSRQEFDKLTRDAIGTPPGQLPAMQIDFEGGDMLRLMLVRLDDHQYFMELIGILESKIEDLEQRLREADNA